MDRARMDQGNRPLDQMGPKRVNRAARRGDANGSGDDAGSDPAGNVRGDGARSGGGRDGRRYRDIRRCIQGDRGVAGPLRAGTGDRYADQRAGDCGRGVRNELWGAPAPMVLRGPSGGGVRGGPFHSANPEMYFVHTPGLKVVYPSTPYDAKGLLKSAGRDNNPVLFFEHKFLYRRIKEEVPPGDYTVPIGKAIVRRQGSDLTIVSYAAMAYVAMEAASVLAKEGIEAEVIDLRTLLPLDRETILGSVRKTNRLLVVHEDTRTGGIAGEIAAIVCEE